MLQLLEKDFAAYMFSLVTSLIDDSHKSHNALGMDANIRVLVVTAHWLSTAWSSHA